MSKYQQYRIKGRLVSKKGFIKALLRIGGECPTIAAHEPDKASKTIHTDGKEVYLN